jgi:O-antigen/teichoic acid export membrane protein
MRAVAELDQTAGVLARGAFVAGGGKFLGKIAAVLGDVIAARMLGPTEFGIYSIGWTAIRFVGLLAPLGLPMGVLKFIPQLLARRQGPVKRLIRTSIAITAGASAALALLLFAGSNWCRCIASQSSSARSGCSPLHCPS